MYFIVSLRVYVYDYVRASVSGLLRPFLSCGFYPLNLHSFIHVKTGQAKINRVVVEAGD